MNVAVFVDAGYLYALCCIARFRSLQPRVRVTLDLDAVLRQLKYEVAALDGGGGRLIRIYWYDGAPKSGMTADQAQTAAASDVKLRLGSVNNYGEQKGVDALIAHDLSELARNRAIDAAILVSGDEDILVGVQTAQTFGVRVHLLGIDPLHSQAQRLRYEADVCHEWPEGLVAPWVSVKGGSGGYPELNGDGRYAVPDMGPIVEAMRPATAGLELAILDMWDRSSRIPRDADSALMRLLSASAGRQLSPHEKPALRQAFIDALRARLEAVAGDDGDDGDAGDAPEHEVAPERVAAIAEEMLPAIEARVPRILDNWEQSRRLPVDVNVHLLKAARDAAGHEIENRAALRETFIAALAAAWTPPNEDDAGGPDAPSAAPATPPES
ncbi:MAG TPA: NYN domain-containing protein [Candidatus Elarobacter sp.]|jgi:uncharacterized LabA/DUF88 family protein